jgi:hypothetical protein
VVRQIRWVGSLVLCLAAASAVAGLLNLLVIGIVMAEVRIFSLHVARSMRTRRLARTHGAVLHEDHDGHDGHDGHVGREGHVIEHRTRRARYAAYLLAPAA